MSELKPALSAGVPREGLEEEPRPSRREGFKAIVECPENAGVLRTFVLWALATAVVPLAVLSVVYEALRFYRPDVLASQHLFFSGVVACVVLVVLPIAYGVLAVKEDREEEARREQHRKTK